jgi:hypothetical protein
MMASAKILLWKYCCHCYANNNYPAKSGQIIFLTMVLLEVQIPGILLEDSTGAIFLIKNQQVGVRTKHVDLRWNWARGKSDAGMLEVIFTKSENNESDILTKHTIDSLHTKNAKSMQERCLFVYENWNKIIDDTAINKKDRGDYVEISVCRASARS